MFNEAEDQQQNMLLRAMAKDPTDLMKMKRAIKMGDKALTNPALRQEILKMLDQMMTLTTTDKSLLQRTRMGFQKAKTMKMPEEVQLEAIGAKDKQDEGEYGYEGDMAMSQLRTIIRNCQEMMKVLDKETDMPEWVQSKITLATDYLQTANDYLMSELEEEVAKDAPFEGGREVKSKESAAVRVKKIALGKKKQYTPKKDKM
jgi:ribosomal protein S20